MSPSLASPSFAVPSFAVIGPGRLGTALAWLARRSGYPLLGFLGGSDAAQARAQALCGGRELAWPELASAGLVLVTPPDDALAEVGAEAAAQGGVGAASLWVHTSGAHDLGPLAPVRCAGARVGSLHPLLPIPDPDTGRHTLPGALAVVEADADACAELVAFAERIGLCPLLPGALDRPRYHAACVLAANGLTALCDLAESVLDGAGLDPEAARRVPIALMRAALAEVERIGAAAALTGPVPRGDAELVRRQRHAVEAGAPAAAAAYRALLEHAVELAQRAGRLEAATAASLRSALGTRDPRGS